MIEDREKQQEMNLRQADSHRNYPNIGQADRMFALELDRQRIQTDLEDLTLQLESYDGFINGDDNATIHSNSLERNADDHSSLSRSQLGGSNGRSRSDSNKHTQPKQSAFSSPLTVPPERISGKFHRSCVCVFYDADMTLYRNH